MNVHKDARLTPSGRVLLVDRIESGWTVGEAAAASGVRSERPISGWVDIVLGIGNSPIARKQDQDHGEHPDYVPNRFKGKSPDIGRLDENFVSSP